MADSPATLAAAGEALLVRAWPVIALSLVNAWVAQPHRGHALHPFQPYRAVVRHHVLILVLGALRAAGNGGTEDTILYVASLACFAAFFLPPRAAPFDREGTRDAGSTTEP